MEKKTPSTFDKLYAINVNDKTDKKGPKGLTYLSWASAWAIVKKSHSGAMYTAYENVDNTTGLVLNYFHDSKTCWVKVGTKLTPDGIEYIMTLPVMDYHYKSISIDKVTSQDVNTAIQRCLVKSLAMHGIGLYIYEKDELPGTQSTATAPKKVAPKKPVAKTAPAKNGVLPPLEVGDNNWGKFVIYAKSVKAKKSIDDICKVASTKYKINMTELKKELTKILK
tara:strand:- start:587 stop:1255 length:669 start_codon:yes stop_codon:yes gene_type:complete